MVASKTFQSQWETSETNKRIMREIEEDVVFWDRKRIRETWPHGYDLSKVNRLTGDPAIIARSITGMLV